MAHFTDLSFEFFYETSTEDASLCLLYHGAKNAKMTKNLNQGGPALKESLTGLKFLRRFLLPSALLSTYVGQRFVYPDNNLLGGF